MKTIKKISAMLFMLAGIMLKTSTVFSQGCISTEAGLTVPFRIEVQAPATNFVCVTTGNAVCSAIGVPGLLTMPGMGVNQNNPNYMLDILCDPTITPATKMDVNISSVGTGTVTPNIVGYRIGDSMMLWHNGIQSSLFVGSWAGGGGYNPRGTENTFVGEEFMI